MTLTFEDAARVLRASTISPIIGSLIDEDGCRCAVGVLGGEELGLETPYKPIFQGDDFLCDKRIGVCYGMDYRLITQIIHWNDSSLFSFKKIADEIDRWAEGDFGNITVDPMAAKPLTEVP